MITLDDLAYHPTAMLSQDVAEIAKPLFEHLGIKGFGCSFSYPDGSKSFLCSNREITLDPVLFRMFNTRSNKVVYGPDLLPLGIETSLFDSDFQLIKNKIDVVSAKYDGEMRKHYLEKYGIEDRLFLISTNAQLEESYIFLFAQGTPYKTIVANNYDLLLKFVLYFKDKAHELIELIKDKPVRPAFRKESVFHGSSVCSILDQSEKKLFLDEISLQKLYVAHNNKVYLTKKEIKYSKYIIKGFSAREIAECCFISKRTVETHIANIKNKLGVSNKSALVEHLIALKME